MLPFGTSLTNAKIGPSFYRTYTARAHNNNITEPVYSNRVCYKIQYNSPNTSFMATYKQLLKFGKMKIAYLHAPRKRLYLFLCRL